MKPVINKKRANASMTDFESEPVLKSLEGVLERLKKENHLKDELNEVNARQLAQTIEQLLRFNDEEFGLEAPAQAKAAMTKIPFQCFKDYDALFHILLLSYTFKIENEWKRFDFSLSNQQRKEKNVELFTKIRKELEEKKFIQQRIFFLAVKNEQHAQLEGIISKLSACSLVTDRTRATHIVEDDPPALVESVTGLDTEFLRTIEQNTTHSFVHWWYYPDCYNQWMPRGDVEGETEPEPKQENKQWRVHARYLRDSERFNEWMNEGDYDLDNMTEEDFKEPPQIDAKTQVVPTEQPNNRQKRSRRRKSAVNETISTPKKRTAEDAELDDENAKKKTKLEQDESMAEQVSASSVVQITPDGVAPPQTEQAPTVPTVVLPSHSAWFKIDEISDIERRSLPEFFDGKTPGKNAQVYKQYRNYMVNSFRKDSARYLTATECRKVLTGDVCAILRVHSFLEQWGLINYGVDPRNKPMSLQALSTSQPMTNMYHDYIREQPQLGGPSLTTPTERLMLFNNVTGMTNNNSRFSIPQAQNVSSGVEWSDEETLRLLDGVDKYKDDWAQIAQTVGGGKTRDQCMTHFVQLPIEDSFLLENDGVAQGLSSSASSVDQPLPFADTSNPIMATIAFLSSMVSPSVAAAAAQAALNAFDQEANTQDLNTGYVDVAKLDVKTASATALGAASARAKLIASKEEKEIQRLVAVVVEKQLKKLELKIKHFEQLEGVLSREKSELEQARQRLAEDKMQMQDGNQ